MPATAEPVGLHGLEYRQPVLLSQARRRRHYHAVLCRLADFASERRPPEAAEGTFLGTVASHRCAEGGGKWAGLRLAGGSATAPTAGPPVS